VAGVLNGNQPVRFRPQLARLVLPRPDPPRTIREQLLGATPYRLSP
jgi:hypothetical protein